MKLRCENILGHLCMVKSYAIFVFVIREKISFAVSFIIKIIYRMQCNIIYKLIRVVDANVRLQLFKNGFTFDQDKKHCDVFILGHKDFERVQAK